MAMRDSPASAAQPLLAPALRDATAELRRAGISDPGDDARRLFAALLGLSTAELLSRPERPLAPDEADRLSRAVARRTAREPVSRILGERAFYGRSFVISPATLDPRADSETLVDAALDLVQSKGWQSKPLRILDVGTGSGCLLLSLLAELPLASGVGTDVSAAALDIARENARRLGLDHRSQWLAADTLRGLIGTFDILVSNPPYIPADQIAHLDPEVRCFDPRAALDGGSDGLCFFRRLAPRIASVCCGWAILEVGHDQADAVAAILQRAMPAMQAQDLRFYRDVAGRRRCVAAKAQK